MLLFSYANWDEILQECIGLCGDHEGIRDDNVHQMGGIPIILGEGTEPYINEPTEGIEREHKHTHDVA